MIEIANTDVYGWEAAIRGARNPMNSWDKSDSEFTCRDCIGCYYQHDSIPGVDDSGCDVRFCSHTGLKLGSTDLKLLTHLANAGPDHGKFLRFINVTVDITAPLYWWKEFDTYKVGTVANSCSTMHKIHAKEFTLDDFSHEHLLTYDDPDTELDDYPVFECERWTSVDVLEVTIQALNFYRDKYLEAKTKPMKEEAKRSILMKKYWWQLIQLLPSSYNQKRTVQLNYAVLRAMYHARKHHKLSEWREFCSWISTLPYSELITGGDE